MVYFVRFSKLVVWFVKKNLLGFNLKSIWKVGVFYVIIPKIKYFIGSTKIIISKLKNHWVQKYWVDDLVFVILVYVVFFHMSQCSQEHLG